VGLTFGIANSPFGRLVVNLELLERTTIEIGLVIRRLQKHWTVRDDLIQLLSSERTRVVGELLDRPPAKVVDPFAWCDRLSACAQLLERGGSRPDAIPSHLPLPRRARAEQVHVVVDESRDDRAPTKVDPARGGRRQLQDLRIGPHCHDAIAADGDRVRQCEALVDGDDLSVREDDVRRWLLRGQGRHGTCQYERHNGCPRKRPSHVSSLRYGRRESVVSRRA
jgi:hypothetical protein